MIAHEQREAAIAKPFAHSHHRDAVLEMPVRVVNEVHRRSVRRTALDDFAQLLRLISKDDVEGRDAGLDRRRQGPENEGPSEYRFQQFGLSRAVLESVPVTGREDDGVPHGDPRS